jgi:hypothetical protein
MWLEVAHHLKEQLLLFSHLRAQGREDDVVVVLGLSEEKNVKAALDQQLWLCAAQYIWSYCEHLTFLVDDFATEAKEQLHSLQQHQHIPFVQQLQQADSHPVLKDKVRRLFSCPLPLLFSHFIFSAFRFFLSRLSLFVE